MTLCKQIIEGGATSFLCTLETAHKGPCATPDIPRSVTERIKWVFDVEQEADRIQRDAGLEPAQTFAEHYMVDDEPTAPEQPPVPDPVNVSADPDEDPSDAIARGLTLISTLILQSSVDLKRASELAMALALELQRP